MRGGKKVSSTFNKVIDEVTKVFLEIAKDTSKKVDEKKFGEQVEEKNKEITTLLKKMLNKIEKVQKRKKDPNAPKRPLTAYLFFCQKHREILTKKHPDLKAPEVTSRLGAEWKKADKKARAPFEKMAKKAKEDYNEAMKSYVPPEGMEKKKKQKKGRTGYNLFCKEQRPTVAKKNKEASPREIMSKLAEAWNGLKDKEKAKYNEKAKQMNKEEGIVPKEKKKSATKKKAPAKKGKKKEEVVEEVEEEHSEHSDDDHSEHDDRSEDHSEEPEEHSEEPEPDEE